jgi:hypothetical protein
MSAEYMVAMKDVALAFSVMGIINNNIATHVKFGVGMDHKCSYILCEKYCLADNN